MRSTNYDHRVRFPHDLAPAITCRTFTSSLAATRWAMVLTASLIASPALAGDGEFLVLPTEVPVTGSPRSVLLEDRDGDGQLDAIAAGFTFVDILRGDGDGGFAVMATITPDDFVRSVALDDVDGDGRSDLVLAIGNPSAIEVRLATDAFTFGDPSEAIPIGSVPDHMQLADVDGDERLDLMTLHRSEDVLRLLRNDALGGFHAPSDVGAGERPNGFAVTDVDGDGRADIIAGDRATGELVLRLSTGGGAFGPTTVIGPYGFTGGVLTEDVDGDGTTDLVTNRHWYRGIGGGSFRLASELQPPLLLDVNTIVDLDGDGTRDIVWGGAFGRVATTRINAAGGQESPEIIVSTAANSGLLSQLAVGDLTGDGRPDLLAVGGSTQSLLLFEARPNGTFAGITGLIDGQFVHDIEAADMNGDGTIDLVSGTSFGGGPTVRLGVGDGRFLAAVPLEADLSADQLALADLNEDGRPDIAVIDLNENALRVYLADPTGGFQSSFTVPLGDLPFDIVAGDFIGNAASDIAICLGPSQRVVILTGDGNGGFSTMVDVPIDGPVSRLAAGDLDADGRPEIIALAPASHAFVLTRGSRDSAIDIIQIDGVENPRGAAMDDVDLDGHVDLIVARANPDVVTIAFGRGDLSFGPLTSLDVDGSPQVVSVGDWSGDGRPDLAVGDRSSPSIRFLLQGPGGAFEERAEVAFTSNSVEWIVSVDLDENGTLDHVVARNGSPTAIIAGSVASGTPLCVGDVDGSGTVDTIDLLTVLSHWGACDDACPSDLDGDGLVGMTDLMLLVSRWGPCVDS
ncbi:MAG: FG-GAP-like repeat-containing protein [Phycisphaerales bacterium]